MECYVPWRFFVSSNPSSQLQALVHKSQQSFATIFGASPEIIACAPGRLNLLGDHIDYNDGVVLPFAIDRHHVIALRRRIGQGKSVRLWSDHFGKSVSFDLEAELPKLSQDENWLRYPWGVTREFQKQGANVPPFDAVVVGNLPVGCGLSSSAALEVGFAFALCELCDHALTPLDLARLCQRAEHDAAGVPCGMMDQVASIFGQAGCIVAFDCRSITIELLPWDLSEFALLVTDTGVRRHLAEGPYAARRQTCQTVLGQTGLPTFRQMTLSDLNSKKDHFNEAEFRIARHVVNEIDRVEQARHAILSSDWEKLGELMFASHASLRDDYQVSWTVADELVDFSRTHGALDGVLGCRMMGGGFGGCVITLVHRASLPAWQSKIQKRMKDQIGGGCWQEEFVPAPGARLVSKFNEH